MTFSDEEGRQNYLLFSEHEVLKKVFRPLLEDIVVLITQFNLWHAANKRLKRDCQRAAFPIPMSRRGFGCCV